MRISVFLLSLLLPLAAPSALAAPEQSVDKLFAQLHSSETAEEAKPLEAQILASFLRSGSPSIDLLMGRADAALAAGQKPVARHLLDEITAIAPGFAEGWHHRALMQQEAGDDSAAMPLAAKKRSTSIHANSRPCSSSAKCWRTMATNPER